jgi:hypothetical protein
VHPTPSLIVGGVPAWQSLTASQVSEPSQNSPLSQRPLLGVCTITSFASSQESSVHPTPSSVIGGVPARQSKVASQVSEPSQNNPLSQLALFGVFTIESDASSQESSVHATPSSLIGGVPCWHWPVAKLQVSSPLQYCPSLQSAPDVQSATAGRTPR